MCIFVMHVTFAVMFPLVCYGVFKSSVRMHKYCTITTIQYVKDYSICGLQLLCQHLQFEVETVQLWPAIVL